MSLMCLMHALLSHVWLFATLWTVACQVPLSMKFPRQEHWSGLPFPPPGDLPDTGIELTSLVFPALVGRFFTTVPPGKSLKKYKNLVEINYCIWVARISYRLYIPKLGKSKEVVIQCINLAFWAISIGTDLEM